MFPRRLSDCGVVRQCITTIHFGLAFIKPYCKLSEHMENTPKVVCDHSVILLHFLLKREAGHYL